MYNYYKSPKGVNKYMQLIILTLYSCDMPVPYKQILISVHSVFPLVYVRVRLWGAWKLHP